MAQRPAEPERAPRAEVADALTAAELAELRAHYASQGAQLDALLGAGARFAAAWAEPRAEPSDSTNGSAGRCEGTNGVSGQAETRGS